MVRNIVVIGGTSHPELTQSICGVLGVPPADVLLSKFAVGETRVEIKESVRGKDVYIIQSGGGKVNDHSWSFSLPFPPARPPPPIE